MGDFDGNSAGGDDLGLFAPEQGWQVYLGYSSQFVLDVAPVDGNGTWPAGTWANGYLSINATERFVHDLENCELRSSAKETPLSAEEVELERRLLVSRVYDYRGNLGSSVRPTSRASAHIVIGYANFLVGQGGCAGFSDEHSRAVDGAMAIARDVEANWGFSALAAVGLAEASVPLEAWFAGAVVGWTSWPLVPDPLRNLKAADVVNIRPGDAGVSPSARTALVYETGIGLRALADVSTMLSRPGCEAPDEQLAIDAAITQSTGWLSRHLVPDSSYEPWATLNINYRALALWGLASAYRAQPNPQTQTVIEAIVRSLVETGCAGYEGAFRGCQREDGSWISEGSSGAGLWHDAEINYHGITSRGIVAAYGALDPSSPMRAELRRAAIASLRHIVDYNGVLFDGEPATRVRDADHKVADRHRLDPGEQSFYRPAISMTVAAIEALEVLDLSPQERPAVESLADGLTRALLDRQRTWAQPDSGATLAQAPQLMAALGWAVRARAESPGPSR
ncbi:MAG: hypothetical protein R3A78_01635 [Polyangiales bacterium]